MKAKLFFIAVLPPEDIQEEVTGFKQYAATHFGSAHALRSPPHITLIPPFRWPGEHLGKLTTTLTEISPLQKSFHLQLEHFSAFPPRVIYVDIGKNEPLEQLQSQLEMHLATKLNIKNKGFFGFHPHMTIAFKDLKKSLFPKAWDYFSKQNYQRSFLVSSFTLLYHSGQNWQIEQSFSFAQ